MDENALKLAYAAPIAAAIVRSLGCDDLDRCADLTIEMINKLTARL